MAVRSSRLPLVAIAVVCAAHGSARGQDAIPRPIEEAPAEAPTEAPANQPERAPAEAPTEAPAEAPPGSQAGAPAETPAELPPEMQGPPAARAVPADAATEGPAGAQAPEAPDATIVPSATRTPGAAPATPIPSAPIAPETPEQPHEASARIDAREPVPETAQEPAVSVGGGMSLGIFNLPNLGVGLSAYAQVSPPGFFPFEVRASYFFDNGASLNRVEQDLNIHPGVFYPFPEGASRIRFQLMQIAAAVCPLGHQLPSGRLRVCGGAYAGLLSATANNFVRFEGDESRATFGLETYLRWRFVVAEPVALAYSAGIFVPFIRDSFGYRDRLGNYQELFRQSVIGGRLDLFMTAAF